MDTARLTWDSPIFSVTAGQKLKKMHQFTELDVRNSEIYGSVRFGVQYPVRYSITPQNISNPKPGSDAKLNKELA